MPHNVIILKKPGGATDIPPGLIVTPDVTGFDTVTVRQIVQATTAASFAASNDPGTAKTCPVQGTSMYFMGVSDLVELPGGCVEYTYTWRGLLTTRTQKVSQTRTVRERYFDSITPTSGTAFPANSRVRLLEMQSGASVRSIHTGTAPTAPVSSANGTVAVPSGLTYSPQYKVTGAPITRVFPNGWICYSWQSEEPIPGIWFVSAEYKYEFPEQSG